MSDSPTPSPLASASAEFAAVFGEFTSPQPTVDIPDEVIALRKRLLAEECQELLDAIDEGDLAHIAKEAGDLALVLRGTTDAYGFDLDTAVTEVHASNLTKVGPHGTPVRDQGGKVTKGPHYVVPDMARTLAG